MQRLYFKEIILDEVLFDPEAEKYVISVLFKNGKDGLIEVDEILKPSNFVDSFYRSCYIGLAYLINEYPDVKLESSSLIQVLKEKRLVHEFSTEDTKLLRAITNMPVEVSNVRRMAVKLIKLSIARQLRENLQRGSEKINEVEGTESIGHILDIAESCVFDHSYSEQSDNRITSIDEGLDDFVNRVLSNKVDQIGYPIGLPEFEKVIGGGVRPGSVVVIGARPKTGKTFLVDHICLSAALKDVHVLNIDTEMMKEDHQTRLLAKVGDLKIDDIETGHVDPKKLRAAAEKLKKIPYSYRSIGGEENNDITSIMRKWLVKNVGLNSEGKAKKPCIVVYDYLKLTDSSQITNNTAEYQVIGFVMTKIHDFAKRYGVGMVVLVQLNRSGIDVEDSSTASQSDRIIWLCTSFSIFKWKDREDLVLEMRKPEESRFTHKLINLLGRYGPGNLPGDFINVSTNYAKGSLIEGPLNSELNPDDGSDEEEDEDDDDGDSKISF